MTVDNSFVIKKLLKKTAFFAAFSVGSNMPYVVCDAETFNDRTWIFDSEELLKKFAAEKAKEKIAIKGVKYPQKAFRTYIQTLHMCGINELVYQEEGRENILEPEKIDAKPNYDNLPRERRPLVNEAIQLTGMYFAQESTRPADVQDEERLEEYQEELASNMLRATYLLPVIFKEGEGTPQEKIKNKQYTIPRVKMGESDYYIPVVSDAMELQKFAAGKPMAALPMNFSGLAKTLSGEVKGYMLNPAGYHLVMTKELLETLPQQFSEE